MDIPALILDTLYNQIILRRLPMKLNVSNTGRTITISFKNAPTDFPERVSLGHIGGTIVIAPDPKGKKISQNQLSIASSNFTLWQPHGKVEVEFVFDGTQWIGELPQNLPEPRRLTRALAEPAIPDIPTTPINLTLFTKRFTFSVPTEELFVLALEWMKKGYAK